MRLQVAAPPGFFTVAHSLCLPPLLPIGIKSVPPTRTISICLTEWPLQDCPCGEYRIRWNIQ